MLDISGSIVVYKNPLQQLQRAIISFLNTSLNVKLYLIDNSPQNRDREFCHDKRITYIFNGRNLGFGAAHNIALRKAMNGASYHLVLNPDVYFNSGVLEELFEFACSRPNVGLLMPKVLYPDGRIQRLCKRLPTPLDIFSRRFFPKALKTLVKSKLHDYELRAMDLDRILSVPYLSGCFMFLRMTSLRELGLFDERFFMYYEDTDLTRRIRARYDTVYFPRVAVFHSWNRESYRSLRLLTHHCISAIRYFNKWGWIWDPEREVMNRGICPIDSQSTSVVGRGTPI